MWLSVSWNDSVVYMKNHISNRLQDLCKVTQCVGYDNMILNFSHSHTCLLMQLCGLLQSCERAPIGGAPYTCAKERVGAFSSVSVKKCPCCVHSDSMPLKQIVGQTIMYAGTASGFEVKSCWHATLNGRCSSQCASIALLTLQN